MLRGLRDALLNVITLGEHEHPGGLRQYGSQNLHALDPRTPEGAINLATMLVPGGKKWGTPSGAQGAFLQALKESSLGGRGPNFDVLDPKVRALMEAIGQPKYTTTHIGPRPFHSAVNPLKGYQQFPYLSGLGPGRGHPRQHDPQHGPSPTALPQMWPNMPDAAFTRLLDYIYERRDTGPPRFNRP